MPNGITTFTFGNGDGKGRRAVVLTPFRISSREYRSLVSFPFRSCSDHEAGMVERLLPAVRFWNEWSSGGEGE